MRNVFGWSLPPGCTNRMIEEAAGSDQPCAVCCENIDFCICRECPVCGEAGNPKCYSNVEGIGHGLKLNKKQVTNRQMAYISVLQDRINDETLALGFLENTEQEEWDIEDVIDPYE